MAYAVKCPGFAMNYSNTPLRIGIRSFTIFIGLMAASWGTYTFPIFLATSGTDAMTSRISSGVPFKTETLLAVLPAAGVPHDEQRARYVRSLAIIRLRLAELDLTDATDHILPISRWENLEASVEEALEWAPGDSYLWFILYWVRMKKDGLRETTLAPLLMSYRCGPYEGWVAVERNSFVMNAFSFLPAALQEEAIIEFKLLVESHYAAQTAYIFARPGWPIHDRLMQQVEAAPADAKGEFAAELYNLNDTVVVPGVVYPNHRNGR